MGEEEGAAPLAGESGSEAPPCGFGRHGSTWMGGIGVSKTGKIPRG